MTKTTAPLSLSSFIVSLREFSRDPAVRRKALKQERPVIIEQSRERGFFVLLPPSLYDGLYELYRTMRDADDVRVAMAQKTEWHDWNDVQKDLAASAS